MAEQKFGSVTHTVEKLDAIEVYLNMYTKALKNKFSLIYFDAFAGTGSVDVSGNNQNFDQFDFWREVSSDFEYEAVADASKVISGSADRALNLEVPFDRYIFSELVNSKVDDLLALKAAHPGIADRVEINKIDANRLLVEFCEKTNWKNTRAVVFLDPFGSQVEWSTIKCIAETKAIDLWYLFPAFWSVYRQISNEGKMTPEQEASIIRILGADDWKQLWLVEQPATTLFDSAAIVGRKQIDVDQITRYMIGRMKEVFAGGVLDEWLPLGPRKQHHFSLLFAWANPKPKAALAAKFARVVMERK